MRHLFTIFLLSMAFLPSTGVARSIADLFATEPGNIFPLLTRTNRLDMVDYHLNGQSVAIANNLSGESRLMELDSAFIKVSTSAGRVVEMRLMTEGRDTVIAVIETVNTPVHDSRVSFWNTSWQCFVNPGKRFRVPTIDDFIDRKMPKPLRADLQQAMIFPLIEMHFTGTTHEMVEATHGLKQFLVSEEYKRYEPYLKPSLRYNIKGTKIKPAK